jgi:beta-lactam-binding protein with PASTA domain
LLIAIVLIVSLFYGTLLFIDKYTGHGKEFNVPDISGLRLENAKDTLARYKLKLEIIDSIYTDKEEKGAIIEQIPGVNEKIKSGRTVFVTINAFGEEKIKMPDFVGSSIRQAIIDADVAGLKIGEKKYVPDFAKNYVLKQLYNGEEIPAGTLIPKGAYIDLEIGQGNAGVILIPNFLGYTLEQADSIANQNFVNISGIFYDESIKTATDSNNAKIYKQDPMPDNNNKITMGSFIDIWLTLKQDLIPKIDTANLQINNNNSENTDEEDIL